MFPLPSSTSCDVEGTNQTVLSNPRFNAVVKMVNFIFDRLADRYFIQTLLLVFLVEIYEMDGVNKHIWNDWKNEKSSLLQVRLLGSFLSCDILTSCIHHAIMAMKSHETMTAHEK